MEKINKQREEYHDTKLSSLSMICSCKATKIIKYFKPVAKQQLKVLRLCKLCLHTFSASRLKYDRLLSTHLKFDSQGELFKCGNNTILSLARLRDSLKK